MARVTSYLMQTDARNALAWLDQVPEGAVALILVRHGQTAWNKERRFLGRTDVPLDATGQAQAQAVSAALSGVQLTAVYTSHLSRAAATAAAICDHQSVTAVQVPDLQELDQGALEGMAGIDLAEAYPGFLEAWQRDPAATRAPGGETLQECHDRVLAAAKEILARHTPGDPIAFITHRMALSCILCEALGLPLRMWHLIGQRNTAVNLLSYRDGRFQVHRINDTAHLEQTPPVIPA